MYYQIHLKDVLKYDFLHLQFQYNLIICSKVVLVYNLILDFLFFLCNIELLLLFNHIMN